MADLDAVIAKAKAMKARATPDGVKSPENTCCRHGCLVPCCLLSLPGGRLRLRLQKHPWMVKLNVDPRPQAKVLLIKIETR